MLRSNGGVAALTIMNPGLMPHLTSADVRSRHLKENTMAYDLGALLLQNKGGKGKKRGKGKKKTSPKVRATGSGKRTLRAGKRAAKKTSKKGGARKTSRKSSAARNRRIAAAKRTSKRAVNKAVAALKKLRTSRGRIAKKAKTAKGRSRIAKTSKRMIKAGQRRVDKARSAAKRRFKKASKKTSRKTGGK
jgi:hypothetical protein